MTQSIPLDFSNTCVNRWFALSWFIGKRSQNQGIPTTIRNICCWFPDYMNFWCVLIGWKAGLEHQIIWIFANFALFHSMFEYQMFAHQAANIAMFYLIEELCWVVSWADLIDKRRTAFKSFEFLPGNAVDLNENLRTREYPVLWSL